MSQRNSVADGSYLHDLIEAAEAYRVWSVKVFERWECGEPYTPAEMIDTEPKRHVHGVCVRSLIERALDSPMPKIDADAPETLAAYLGALYGRAERVRLEAIKVLDGLPSPKRMAAVALTENEVPISETEIIARQLEGNCAPVFRYLAANPKGAIRQRIVAREHVRSRRRHC